MCPCTCTAPKHLVCFFVPDTALFTKDTVSPRTNTIRRRRRKYGTDHGGPRRRLAVGNPISHTRKHPSTGINRRHPSSRPRLFLPTRHRPSQAFPWRCPAELIQVLLRQARPEASDLTPVFSHQYASLSCERISDQRCLAGVPVLVSGMQALFLCFCC